MRLHRIIFQGFGFWRWVGGLGGALLGWCLLFGGWQVWRIVDRNILGQSDILSPEYFVIHKPVPMVNLFGAGAVSFSPGEIDELRKQSFVKSVAPFEFNRFNAHADFGADFALAAIETDLFFEAVPDEYLDGKLEGWHWEPGDTNLPVIISRDYLALYNFGFAQSRGLPRISDALVRQLRFNVRISGRGQELVFKGRIAGFSQRINTILAPLTFVQWANSVCGEGQGRPSRLIVQADAAATPRLLEYFSKRSYEYNTEQVRTARIGSAMRLLFGVVAIFGVTLLGLAFWIFALSFQLVIAQNRESLRKLIWMGYHPAVLVKRYVTMLGVAIIFLDGAGLAFLFWGARGFTVWLGRNGYAAEGLSIGLPVLGMGLLSLALLVLNYGIIRKQIYRLD